MSWFSQRALTTRRLSARYPCGMSRTIMLAVLLVVGRPATGAAQVAAEPGPSSPERISVGLATNLAVEGSGPWFAPGIRVGVPVTRRLSLDLESSAVFGGKLEAPYGSITSFLALNARRLRDGTGVGRHRPVLALRIAIHADPMAARQGAAA